MAGGPTNETPPAMSTGRLLLLIGALLLGVASAAVAIPPVFRATPTDVSRIGTLLTALRDPAARPEVVVFGNSVLMSAVDGRQLTDSLPGRPLAYNLASTGQSMVESYLLYQELPDSVRDVVQLASVLVADDAKVLDRQKYNTFYMNGFRPTAQTRQRLDGIFGAEVTDQLDSTGLSQSFLARWAIRQLVDTQLRVVLRRDLTLASAERDLYHPQRYNDSDSATRAYADSVRQQRVDRGIAAILRRLGSPPKLRVHERQRRLIAQMIANARADGARLTLLLPPIHPKLRAALNTSLPRAIASFSEEVRSAGADVFDASLLLEDEHFVDSIHPNNAGAAVVTRALAEQLASHGSAAN